MHPNGLLRSKKRLSPSLQYPISNLDIMVEDLGRTHSILFDMENINTLLIEAQPITPTGMKIGCSGTRGSTSYTSLTGISESSRNSSHIVERAKKSKSNRDESMPQPDQLHFDLEQVGSFQNQKCISSDKAAYVVRALTKAAASSVVGTARDLSFFKDVLDQATAINAVNKISKTSNESAKTSNSSDKSNLSLSQLVDLLGKNSRNIIKRQQDEIRCLRLAVKELVGELLDEGEIIPRHEEGFPDVIEFQSSFEEEEKTRSLAPDRSPAVVSIRPASSHSHDIIPRGKYTQQYTEISSSKGSFESNLSFQNDGNEDNEEYAAMGECVQLEIPDDATQPPDLSTTALSVGGEQINDGKAERGALDIQNTPEAHAEHEEEPSPITNIHNLSSCHQEQEGDQALHSFEAPSLTLAANETETEENDTGFTEMERSSLTDQTELAQQASLLRVVRQDSGESEARPPSRHLEARRTPGEFAREIVDEILQQVVDSGATKESFEEIQYSSHSDVLPSVEVDDGMLSVGPSFANLIACGAIELPEELTMDLSSSHFQHEFVTDDSDFLRIASLFSEEFPARELQSLNQTDEEIREQILKNGYDTYIPVNFCVGNAVDSDADDHSEHYAVFKFSSDSVSPGSLDPAESTPSYLSKETDEEIKEESTDPERIITNITIGEEDTEAGHSEAAENTIGSSSKHISSEPESVEIGATVDVPAESAEGASSFDDASKEARAITSERPLDDNHESPVTNNSGPPASSRQSFGPDQTENIEKSPAFPQHIRIRRNFPDDKGDAHPNKPYRSPTRRRPTDFLSAKSDFDHCMHLETTMYIRESEPSFITVTPRSNADSWVVTEEK